MPNVADLLAGLSRSRLKLTGYRVIPSRFPPIDVFARLGPEKVAEVAKEIEDLTNPRLRARAWLVSGATPLSANSPRLQNWNHAPFVYRDPEGTTFLGPVEGAMELAVEVGGALVRGIIRRERFLRRTNEDPMPLDMRMLVTAVDGDFLDYRDREIVGDHNPRWAMGAAAKEAGLHGIRFIDPACRASCVAVFNPNVLGTAVQAAHYRFVWDGEIVNTVYDFSTGRTWSRAQLFDECAGGEEAA